MVVDKGKYSFIMNLFKKEISLQEFLRKACSVEYKKEELPDEPGTGIEIVETKIEITKPKKYIGTVKESKELSNLKTFEGFGFEGIKFKNNKIFYLNMLNCCGKVLEFEPHENGLKYENFYFEKDWIKDLQDTSPKEFYIRKAEKWKEQYDNFEYVKGKCYIYASYSQYVNAYFPRNTECPIPGVPLFSTKGKLKKFLTTLGWPVANEMGKPKKEKVTK